MEEVKVKRIRSGNMTLSEKAVLADLCIKYGEVIECKATDGASKSVKAAGWNQLCAEFNAQTTTGLRTVAQLKHAFENLKHKAKKSSASEKIERSKTGGGTFVSPIDDVDNKMLSLLGHRAVPLTNLFDSDASYNADELTLLYQDTDGIFGNSYSTVSMMSTPVSISVLSAALPPLSAPVSSDVFSVPTDVSSTALSLLSAQVSSSPATLSMPSSSSAAVASDVAVLSVVSSSTSAPVFSVPSSTSAPASTALATAIAGTSRQWANRRRPRPARLPRATANQAAVEKIADLTDIKAAYYKEKLAMKRQQHDLFLEEHTKRMKLLELQEQIAAKQLSRLEE